VRLHTDPFPARWPCVGMLFLCLAEPPTPGQGTELSEADWQLQADHFLARWSRLGGSLKCAFGRWCDSKDLLHSDRRAIWRVVRGRLGAARAGSNE
jgi:hypothetical protein